tara:strand:- start:221 stop:661 length:441 start_codon:yes stop_codon:yes gene_type:complete
MDPITVMTVSFAAVRTAIKTGKDLHSMGKDLGKLWGAIDDAKNTHASATRGKGSASERALTTYISAVKARDFEAQLRDIIITARGFKGWNELQAIRVSVMKEEREGRYRALKKKNQIVNALGMLFGALITVGGGALLLWAAIEFKP